jgi:hypothetical protein
VSNDRRSFLAFVFE